MPTALSIKGKTPHRKGPAQRVWLTAVLLAAFIIFLIAAAAPPAFAAEDVEVKTIQPVYVERGDTNYMVTLRAHVVNNGDSEEVSLPVVGKDDDGYVLHNFRFSGTVGIGQARMLMERFQIRGETYERITEWEVRR